MTRTFNDENKAVLRFYNKSRVVRRVFDSIGVSKSYGIDERSQHYVRETLEKDECSIKELLMFFTARIIGADEERSTTKEVAYTH